MKTDDLRGLAARIDATDNNTGNAKPPNEAGRPPQPRLTQSKAAAATVTQPAPTNATEGVQVWPSAIVEYVQTIHYLDPVKTDDLGYDDFVEITHETMKLIELVGAVIHRDHAKNKDDQTSIDATIRARIVADMMERDLIGRQKYGTPLTTNNGRSFLIDAYQELLDLYVYATGMKIEHEAVTEQTDEQERDRRAQFVSDPNQAAHNRNKFDPSNPSHRMLMDLARNRIKNSGN